MNYFALFVCTSLLWIGTAESATILNEIAGTRNSAAYTKLSLAGIGSLRYPSQVSCSFVAIDDINGRFSCYQDGYGKVASGGTRLIAGGSLLSWMLDLEGMAAIEHAITGTLDNIARQWGGALNLETVEYDVRSLAMSPIKIEGNTPTAGTLTVKGYVSGDISERHYRKAFTYKTTVTFGSLVPGL